MDSVRLTVLVVDDDEPTRRLLQTLLQRSGYIVRFASNGAEAIALLRTTEFAAVILDLMMPAVTGRDVVDFLAASSSGTPVVVCSAASPSMFQGLDPSVVKAVIRKPFDVDEFTSIIGRVTVRGTPMAGSS